MIKEIYMKVKPLFLILLFITICSCEFEDDGEDCLGKDGVEAYAEVLETSDSFIVSGYFKSLKSSKKTCSTNHYGLELEVDDPLSWENVEITVTIDGVSQEGFLGELSSSSSNKGDIVLAIPELTKSSMKSDFSVEFRKNVPYKINLKLLFAFLGIGLRHGDGFGCGEYMKTEDLVFEINHIIESI